MAQINPDYTATATTTGGRNGHIRSESGVIDMKTVMPKEIGGPGGAFTNPEELFAAGYSSCFGSATKAALDQMGEKVDPDKIKVTASVGIGKDPNGGFGLTARILLEIDGMDAEKTREVAHKAHEICPYSKATRGNIEVEVTSK